MSWFDFLKFKTSSEMNVNLEPEELSQEKTSVYISFDKASLRVSGGIKEKVSQGIFDWKEEVFLDKFTSDKNINTATLSTMAINDLQHRLEGGQDVSVSLPLESVFAKYITIPKNNIPEKLLQSEMKKYVPLPFSEMLFASNKVAETEKESSYFCIVAQKTLFDSYVSIFRNYGIQPNFELGCFSLARLAEEGIHMMIWFGEGESYILLVKNRILIECAQLSITYKNLIEAISTNYDISYDDSKILLKSYFAKTIASKESVNAIEEKINPILISLAREIVTANSLFTTTHRFIIEKNILIGLDIILFNKIIGSITDSLISVERFPNLIQEDNRYTHHIGLAKRN